MPLFTIESTYRLPVYRHRTYEAASLTEACRLAIEDDDWESAKRDYESVGETYLTGAWVGADGAYRGQALRVPTHFDETVQRKAVHFEVLLGLVKMLSGVGDAKQSACWAGRATSAVAKAEAILAGMKVPLRMRRRRARTFCCPSTRARCARRSARSSRMMRPSRCSRRIRSVTTISMSPAWRPSQPPTSRKTEDRSCSKPRSRRSGRPSSAGMGGRERERRERRNDVPHARPARQGRLRPLRGP